MNNTRELPRHIDPTENVTLASYVEQLAAMYKVSLLVMLKYLGIIPQEKYEKLNGYGILLSSSRVENFAKASRLSEARVREMLLRHYDGICINLSGIEDTPDALRRISVSEWAYFSGSHACPGCIAESSGGWKLKWKLPWSFVCVKHKCYLVENCPQCNGRLGSGRADGSLSPLFVNMIPKPGFCGNRQGNGLAIRGKSAVPCGHDLSALQLVPASPPTQSTQLRLDRALLGIRQLSMGDDVSARDYFADLKGLCALLLYGAALEDLGELPRFETLAFKRFAEERDAKRAVRIDSATPKKEPRTRVLYGVQTEPALMAAVSGFAIRILGAKTIEEAADELRPVGRNISMLQGKNRWELSRHFHFSERLNNAYKLALETTSTFNRTVGALSVGASRGAFTFEPRHVPQLLWRSEFERHFAAFFPEIHEDYARRFCSMSLMKLCAKYTWAETAELLDLPQSAVKMANRAVGFIANPGQKKRFASRLHELAGRISANSERIDYAARRQLLSNFTEIPAVQWARLCEESGVTVGKKGGRDKYAAAWIWADTTAGDWKLAPSLRNGNAINLREVYRQLQRTIFPQMESALQRYGKELLGDLAEMITD